MEMAFAEVVRVPGLVLRPERSRRRARIVIAGELDAHSSRSLELLGAALLSEIDDGGALELDCAEVRHVASDGLAAILELARAADARSTSVEIVRPSRPVRRLLDLAGLQGLCPRRPPDPV
jgi:anti-anti-sigma factor